MENQSGHRISICIITYNRPVELLELLQNLNTLNGYEQIVSECIILNNASNVDYSCVEKYISEHPELKINYTVSNINHGVARGRNIILEQAIGEYLLVIDDDIEFSHTDDLVNLIDIFLEEKYVKNKTAIINFDVFYHSTKERQKTAFPHKKLKKYVGKSQFFTGYFIGAAGLYRKDFVNEVNYFPDDILYGMEEYDLSYKLIKKGYTLAYDNRVKIWHKESPKGRVTPKEKLSLLWRNKALVFWSHAPIFNFITVNFFWGARYLIKSKFDVIGFFKTVKSIRHGKKHRVREPFDKKSKEYLAQVEARLLY